MTNPNELEKLIDQSWNPTKKDDSVIEENFGDPLSSVMSRLSIEGQDRLRKLLDSNNEFIPMKNTPLSDEEIMYNDAHYERHNH